MRPVEYWRSGAGLAHITPPRSPNPEGEGFGDLLREVVGAGAVLDFGCGPGRLSGMFDAGRYIGVDVCPEAVALAQRRHPGMDFRMIDDRSPILDADVTLAHTVLLHVSDDDLLATISRFGSRRVIVSEIMGRHWRRDGNPPVFNREADEYAAAFLPAYQLRRTMRHPYPHYRGTDLTILVFER